MLTELSKCEMGVLSRSAVSGGRPGRSLPLEAASSLGARKFSKLWKRGALAMSERVRLESKLKPRTPIRKLRLSMQDKLVPILKETIRPMKFNARIPVSAALLALLLMTATGCNRLKARDQLTKGVQAFKNARYEEAVNHFQQSIALDPNYEDA